MRGLKVILGAVFSCGLSLSAQAAGVAPPYAAADYCQRYQDELCGPARVSVPVVMSGALHIWGLKSVNNAVNHQIRFVEDMVQFGVPDHWDRDVIKGDCEEYAIAKYKQLEALGWPTTAMDIAVAETGPKVFHTVLIVRTDQGDLVLDNIMTDLLTVDRYPAKIVLISQGSILHWQQGDGLTG